VMHPSMYCEYRFSNGKKGGKEKLFYCCKFHRENKTCKQQPVECSIIDRQVIQLMNGFNLPDDIIKMTLEKLRGMFKISRKETKQDDRIFEILGRKKRLKTMFEMGHMPESEFLFKIQRADEEIEHMERQGVAQNMTVSQQEQHIKKTEEFLKNFPKFWSQIEKEEKREWIRMAIKRIWVKNRKVVAIEPRDDFKALFSAHRKVIGQSPVLAPLYPSNKSISEAPSPGAFVIV
jgi:hypothetical protein